MIRKVVGFVRGAQARLLFALVLLAAAPAAFATGGGGYTGISEAEIQSVYTGILTQFGTWVGVVVGILAVMVGTLWIIRRFGGGSGIR